MRDIGGVGVFPLRVTLQPFFKHTVNSSVVEDEELIIGDEATSRILPCIGVGQYKKRF